MNILFKSKKLEKQLTIPKETKKTYGTMAARVAQRMESLQSAPSLGTLISLQALACHPLQADRNGEWAISLSGNYRLLFEITQASIPKLEDGGIDTSQITDIRILEITDYH